MSINKYGNDQTLVDQIKPVGSSKYMYYYPNS